MPDIFVDEVNRIFKVDDIRYSSITEVLQEEGFVDATWYTEDGAEDGKRRHIIFQLDDLDDLVEDSVDEDDLPYLMAWRKCKAENNIKIIEIEQRSFYEKHQFNHTYRVCGKPDTKLLYNGTPEVWDKKTGGKAPWHRFQIGGQLCLHDDVFHGRCVYLKPNGMYEIGPRYGRKEREDFLTILRTNQLRKEGNHGRS